MGAASRHRSARITRVLPLAAAGVLVSACASRGPVVTGPGSTSPATTGTSTGTSTGTGGAADGDPVPPGPGRAIYLQVLDLPEDRTLAASTDGRVGTSPGGSGRGERERFVLTPRGPGASVHELSTARRRVGGEPSCVARKAGTLRLVACDLGQDAQAVTLSAIGTDPLLGPVWRLTIGGGTVRVDPHHEVTVTAPGSSATGTRFVTVDAGAAPDRDG